MPRAMGAMRGPASGRPRPTTAVRRRSTVAEAVLGLEDLAGPETPRLATPRLGKRHAERLVGAVEADADTLCSVIAASLTELLGDLWDGSGGSGVSGGSGGSTAWDPLIDIAARHGDWPPERHRLVRAGGRDALERLAVDLSELRTLRLDGPGVA